MIEFIDELYNKMTESLQSIINGQENLLRQAEQAYRVADASLHNLKNNILSYTFKDKEEEIRFFKEEKPKFLKEFIYFKEVFYIEYYRPVGTVEVQKQYFSENYERIRIYFNRNNYLYSYYRTGQTYLDETIFFGEAQEIPLLPAYSADIDSRFSNVYSYKIAKLQAFEQLKDYLLNAIRNLENATLPVENKPERKRWLGTKAELIELGYALQSRGIFGNANVKQVIHYLEDCFDIKVGNFYRVFQGQRIRKKSRTLFLDSLKENLIHRMNESDLNPRGF